MRHSLLGGCIAVLTATNAAAGDRCVVRAPSNKPQSVVFLLNGPFLAGEVPNGTRVSMLRVERDRVGRPWAYITRAGQALPVYLPRDFLVCY
jgi:hypothetical protein